MYTQEIVCPSCGELTNVNVPDVGEATTPCKAPFCGAEIKIVVNKQGRVAEIKDVSGCIVSTACFEAAGLSDDCAELGTLRAFRDWYVRERPEGSRIITEYYAIAPTIVQQINNQPERRAIWADIYVHLQRIICSIEAEERDQAISTYRSLIQTLGDDFLVGHGPCRPLS